MKKLIVGLLTIGLLGTTTYAHHGAYKKQCQPVYQTTYCQHTDVNHDNICDNCKMTYYNTQKNISQGHGYHHHH